MPENNEEKDSQKIEVKVSNSEPEKSDAFQGPMSISHDKLTNDAIDDITRSEADTAIKVEDEKLVEEFTSKPGFKQKVSRWFHSWWDVPKKRYTVLGISAAFLLLIFVIPPTRYAVLNTVGVRASANIIVLDESTDQPLKNVSVTVRGQTSETDIDGRATFSGIKLGSTEIVIDKIAYAENKFSQTIGLGGNDLGNSKLTPIGTQFEFRLFDWLSNSPIDGGEVTFGESSALSDQEGKAVLTIEPTDETKINVVASADEYRDQDYELTTTSTDKNELGLKTGSASYFVSNRNGKYDVYKMYVDEEPEVIVAGTGQERDDIRFSISPDRKYAVLVSTRDGVRNDGGFLLSGLFKLNLETMDIEKIDESERIDLVGWADNKLVYVKVAAGASGRNPERHRLQTVDLSSGYNNQIAASNYFNDIVVNDNSIYYAPSNAYKSNPETALFRSDSSGNSQIIHDSEVWTLIQSGFNELTYDATGTWFNYSTTSNTSSELDGPPSDRVSKIYVQGPENKSLWIDQRDGKGSLILNNSNESKDDVVWEQPGLRYPVQWLSDKHIVFRVVTVDETADYIVNIEGGDAKKLTDVSNVSGVDRWYYY